MTNMQAGILSDTHLTTPSPGFARMAEKAFKDCDVLFHAGDLTDSSLLQVFTPKTVYAVHGNMCSAATKHELPHHRRVTLAGYTIGICHGAGRRDTIIDRMWDMFPDVDCIIFGHTHIPYCRKHGDILFINPGSFQASSSYGAEASYAILTINEEGLQAKLYHTRLST